jgi:DNA-binding LytR/AlgR family response regulator
LWVMAEVVIISIFYTHFTFVFIPPVEESVINIVFKAFGCILLIMAIPYTILTLYAAYRTKTEELQMLQYEMSMGEGAVSYPSLVNLYDYNGTLKLTINSDSLYYMESQDNYIKIHYENNGKLCSYMLRSRTKSIEESLADTSIVRCQRSYLVNVMKINHIKKGGKLRYIVLEHDDIKPIPVSESYFKNLLTKIDKFNAAALKDEKSEAEA